MSTIEIPVRELHSRTGHYVRKAAENQRIVITDRGKAVAELQPLTKAGGHHRKWKDRILLPEFAKLMKQPIGGSDSTQIISEDRDRGSDW
ncbi:MAG: type II toxin-antitoxin system Phd/YefM family antitoxin [Terrimicrobiaceae bacterium]